MCINKHLIHPLHFFYVCLAPFFILIALNSHNCLAQGYNPILKGAVPGNLYIASPYDFGGENIDYSWKQIYVSTHTDNGYNNFYYDNIFCKNKSSRAIYVGVTYCLRKTKRRLFGGLDYPLEGAYISEEQYTGCVVPPQTTVGLIPGWYEVITKLYTRQDRGIYITSITCQYVD